MPARTRRSIGFKQPKVPPKELNFDIWLGPATKQPYHENIVHYNWHWFWDFGNGEIGNQGVHQMDIARWALPDGAEPRSVISLGGRFGYEDQGQTPNTQLTIIDCGEAKIFFEDRGLVDGKTMKVTNEFYMEGGVIKDGMFFPKGKTEGEPMPGDVRLIRTGCRPETFPATSSTASAAASGKTSTPKSWKGTYRQCFVTWEIFLTGWVRRSPLMRKRRPSATTRPPTRPWKA